MKIDGTIGFVGAGNMAEALIRGLLRGGEGERVAASTPRAERIDELRARYGIEGTTDNVALAARSDIVVLCVKPQIMRKVLEELAPNLRPDTLVISVAAGVPIAAIELLLPPGVRVIRAMPNMPALVDAGATAISRGGHASEADLALAKRIFDSVGITVVLDEQLLDAVTGLSGSGPAYIFLVLEALADAGVKVGLSRRTAQTLAAQTVLGSAKLLLETGEHPGQLKDRVTSPGGTAIAGLHTLEAGGLRTTLIDAVEAATRRSHELGLAMLRSVEL
ncbi:MAG: pyrroline-5-carboxylate reductase [Myxococcales bacterium]|nr:pyrroline-5-carboxylate reductase [Myxococcales bacterium]